MKTFLIFVSLSVVVLGQDNTGSSELAECGSKFADKIQALCGNFLDKDEIVDLLQKSFDMYYKQGKTLKEINDYFIANYRNVGLDAEQVDTITDVLSKVTQILGGSDALKQYHEKAQQLALDFIKPDQQQVDANIQTLKSVGTNDAKVELAVCQQVFALATAQKKIQLENKMFGLVPADKLEALKVQARRVTKLLSDSLSL